MSVTSLKLPDELKKRIAALIVGSGRSAHAFMVEAMTAKALAIAVRTVRSNSPRLTWYA